MSRHLARRSASVIVAASLLGLGACSIQKPNDPGAGGGAQQNSLPAVKGPDSVPKVDESQKVDIAFFGFARANSFATATFTGLESYAKEHNAAMTFFDPNFDGQKQASQIQDAVTSKRFKVFVVQANDGTAVMPAVQQAVQAGIKVVVEFTPIGPRYDTAEPQVPGTITLIDVPTENGKALGEMALQACKERQYNPCKVAYLEGFKSLPLDNARTKVATDTVKAGGAQIVRSVEGGYTNDSGRKAMQDVLQSAPDVNVVVGSTQAIAGAEQAAAGKDIAYIGNGGSRQAINAVKQGRWFGVSALPEVTAGKTAAALGLAAARGGAVPTTNASTVLAPDNGKGTKQALQNVEGEYDE